MAFLPLGTGTPAGHDAADSISHKGCIAAMPTAVTQTKPAASALALEHFSAAATFETDCWDVHDALSREPDFVLVDVRNPEAFARGHVPGAVNIPHGKLIESRLAQYPAETVFVVYCAGPHCNGGHKGALRLARLDRPVKLMIGGITGWIDEGFELTQG
jgi:rhodanese-related sulfurtransferase